MFVIHGVKCQRSSGENVNTSYYRVRSSARFTRPARPIILHTHERRCRKAQYSIQVPRHVCEAIGRLFTREGIQRWLSTETNTSCQSWSDVCTPPKEMCARGKLHKHVVKVKTTVMKYHCIVVVFTTLYFLEIIYVIDALHPNKSYCIQ